MKTSKLIGWLEDLKEYRHASDEGWDTIDEVVQKLRQLGDIKRMLWEMWDLSAQRDEIQFDINQMVDDEIYPTIATVSNFQEGDINYGRKE